MRRATLALYIWAALLALQAPALAHETDHFSVPAGRDMADLGDFFSAWAYDALASAVDEANADADAARQRGDDDALREIASPDYIFNTTYNQFPAAYFLIEGLEQQTHSEPMQRRHPGKVVAYKQMMGGSYTGAYLPIDPRQLFRVWHASVVKAYGVYFGTDKIGHFADMGKNYYQTYRNALRDGKSEPEAVAAAVSLGTDHPIYSESALLGFWTAGAYSNGDLAANYAGFLFYRNLTEPVTIAGEQRPPLLQWDGRRWHLADHVERDGDFFSYFITDHWDEALNPSLYEGSMRDGFRRNMLDRADNALYRYRDANDNRRLPIYFLRRAAELASFAGDDYGHRGNVRDLLTLAEAFEPFDDDAPLDARNARGHTPLHDAIAWTRPADARQLLERGAAVNARVRSDDAWSGEAGCTPLHLAARTGRPEIVRLLLEFGANLHARDARHATALHYAAEHPEVAAALLEAGASLDSRTRDGQTPLHWAAALDAEPTVRLLLDRGSDANRADAVGRTALHRAAKHGSADTVAALAEQGDRHLGDVHDTTALHLAAQRQDAAAEQVVAALLEAGADPNLPDVRGRTAMHEAARTGSRASLALLAEYGGRVDLADAFRTTPLHLASRSGRDAVAQWLIDRGAAIDFANAAGATPLHEAAFAGRTTLVRRMVAAGANPDARDALNRTPAAVANAAGFDNLARLLNNREATDSTMAIERRYEPRP